MTPARTPRWPLWTLVAIIAGTTAALTAARAAYGVLLFDQANIVLHTQDISWVQDEQVPFYAWMLTGLMRLTGNALIVPDLVKFAGLAMALAGLFAAGRRLGGTGQAGLIAALSAFLLPTMNEDLLREYTHSAGVIGFAGLSMWLLVAEPRQRGWPLGLVWAGGLLMKHNMALVMASQALADRRAAGRWDARLGLALAIASGAALPIYLVMLLGIDTVTAGTAEFLGERGPWDRLRGLGDLVSSVLAEGALLLVLLGIAHWRLRRAGGRPARPERLLLWSLAFALAIYAAIILAANVAVVRDRWLAPSLLALCPVAAAWLARGASARVNTALALVLAALAALLVAHRATEPLRSDGDGQGARAARPYPAALALIEAQRGGEDAVLLADRALAATWLTRRPGVPLVTDLTMGAVPDEAARVLVVTTPLHEAAWMTPLLDGFACEDAASADLPYRYGNSRRYALMVQRCEEEPRP